MKNPQNGGHFISTLPAIFQGCYIQVRNHLQVHLGAAAAHDPLPVQERAIATSFLSLRVKG